MIYYRAFFIDDLIYICFSSLKLLQISRLNLAAAWFEFNLVKLGCQQ